MNKIKSTFTYLKKGWSAPPEDRHLTFKKMVCYGFSGLGVSFIVNVITAVPCLSPLLSSSISGSSQ